MSAPLLQIDDLSVTYWDRSLLGLRANGFEAVKRATLTVDAGQTLGLVGESGSGKSSIANALLGLVPPSGGTINFDGQDLATLRKGFPPEIRQKIQAVFQDPYSSLNPSMTVEEIVTEPLKVHTRMTRVERHEKAVELLKLVKLPETHLHRYPNEFSGGQRQRIAIATALALQPSLIVLDEPVSALDVSTQNQIINLLYERRDALGISYLLIAHDLALVHHISDRIAVMYLGHIVEEGPADRVYHQPAHPYTQALLEAVPLLDPARQRARRAERRGRVTTDMPRLSEKGCPFSGRCPHVMDRCTARMPPAFTVPDGGTARCFLLDDEPNEQGRSKD
ncbi:oligopeptide/dipeptide ABC transporter ATP-binding protein [Aquicoccus porphyridii]|uniref:ABC transporter ATP-binding protein n=1 Tax=Aquicoccus porphyridii TaxID=1852029 RepID=A0A5A9ZCZ4_9RHOB|nr:ABC transporter ATP-binding protein [Aquicoccus porphyridii]KAA0914946.1 ABC transporter ATP-binding protein [Aquicoccus porphyridii]RAI52510.1 oligopeptide ABC transporter ATP-binding protein [Rhodobacteraceae bacterium AsT-22]